ncbi:hypothetical protein N9852_03030 [Alphaproteobacteria bacterium]|nr:hypothetical protein [Alphaproteobacteria bacterium]
MYSGQSCNYDYFGNYVCTGTGSDYGYRSETKKDYFGNDKFSDNRGNNMTCKTDYFGNYVCN